MGNLVSGNNAKSEYKSAYPGKAGRVKSSAGVVVLPKKKGAVKKGRADSRTVKRRKRSAVAASRAVIRKRMRRDARIRYAFITLLVAAAALISLAIIVFANKVSYYSDHFYDGTVINGIDVSGMTLAEAGDAMQHLVNDYSLTVTDYEGRTYYAGAGVFGLTFNDDGTLAGILENQMPFLWMFKSGTEEGYDISNSLDVNRNSLEAWVSSLDCAGEAVMPEDAYVTTDEDGFYYIVPETYGNAVDLTKMYDIVENAVKTGAPILDMTDPDTYCYFTPSVYATDPELHEQMAAGNERVRTAKELEKKIIDLTDVTVVLAGQYENYTLDQAALLQWIKYDDKNEPYLDYKASYDWVNSFAEANGLLGSNYLFRTHDGYIVTVDQGTQEGWSMDVKATGDMVADALKTKTSGTIYPVMVSSSGVRQNEDSYIEISLYDQMMWYFQNGNVVLETPIVSGNVLADLTTPSFGVWALDYKATGYRMMAPLNEDGSRDYDVTVNYWLPFNNDIGIHDISWREEYGGDIYVRDGSHGCINTPLDKVAQLYDMVDTGTKVVVYGS